MREKQKIEIEEGGQLWPLVSLLVDTYYDDVTAALPELMDVVRKYRITDANGKRPA